MPEKKGKRGEKVKMLNKSNKKVFATFAGSLCFLLVLYCTLSQLSMDINSSLLMASTYNINTKVVEDNNKLDANELLKKDNELSKVKFVNVDNFGDIALLYSARYNVSSNPLNSIRGTVYFNGHKETYYSEKVLPGNGLNIPGRHVAEDGTIRDYEGFICVASDLSFMSRGTVLMTSLVPAKVYDTGCAYGTIDIYVNW